MESQYKVVLRRIIENCIAFDINRHKGPADWIIVHQTR